MSLRYSAGQRIMNENNEITLLAAKDLINTEINFILESDSDKDFVTDSIIESAIDDVMKMSRYSSLDKDELFDLISYGHSSLYEEEAKILINNLNHEEWFDESNDSGYHRDIEWKFWRDYKNHLIQNSKFSPNIVNGKNGINFTVNKILAALDDPTREGVWDRRGLVVGEVQSGKTANYIGLSCKAADAGYKLIIIFAGLYNDLRAQTQQRVDEGFYGFNSDKGQVQDVKIGVGNFINHPTAITYTDVKENGDFAKSDANVVSPHIGDKPIILVVKKNVNMLVALADWVERVKTHNNLNKVDAPLLIIDDECDNASINTKKYSVANYDDDGEHEVDPTAINYGIRNLMNKFNRSAYVGYTATPFANILIKRNDKHKELGEDLFPRDFILNIPRPSNHIGPEQFFGISGDDDLRIEKSKGYPLRIQVRDGDVLLPDIAELKTEVEVPEELNASLKRAIKSFIISCAARYARGQVESHNSMLIHVTHYVNAQIQIHEYVEDEINKLKDILLEAPSNHFLWKTLEDMWNDEYLVITRKMNTLLKEENMIHEWDVIKEQVPNVLKKIVVRLVNGKSKDALDYARKKENKIFRNYIAVGGNRLARGLTLDSLTVSYFLRSSKMNDTLLQMGRWFGYREGYLDLCRIYTTDGLIDAYKKIALATVELKQEFDYMYSLGERPENWGLKIRSHPKILMVTGYGKSHWSTKAKITFDARLMQTHNTIIRKEDCLINQNVIEECFVNKYEFKMNDKNTAYLNHNINSNDIIAFSNKFKLGFSIAWKPAILGKYIKNRNDRGQLTDWTVGILSSKTRTLNGKDRPLIDIGNIHGIIATNRNGQIAKGKSYVSMDKAILSKSHEWLDWPVGYDTENKKDLMGDDGIPNGVKIRENRKPSRVLLLIYPLYGKTVSENELSESEEYYGIDPSFNVFGAVFSFPGSKGFINEVEYVFDEKSVQLEFGF